MQMQNFTFARQEVVFDLQAVHGLKMTPQYRDGNQIGNRGCFVCAFLDGVQRLLSDLQILLVLGVPM